MACMSEHHQNLDENGVGKCSVPMWKWGLPDGFCDQPAYGKQQRHGGLTNGHRPFAPGLACPGNGGPFKKSPFSVQASRRPTGNPATGGVCPGCGAGVIVQSMGTCNQCGMVLLVDIQGNLEGGP